jgi:hypothetical protein
MTFDDQLKRASETLTERLRVEIDRHVQTIGDEIAAAARTELETAVAAARVEAHEAGRGAGHHDGFETGRRQGRLEGRAQAERESPLADSVRAIGRATSLTGILDALLTSAANQAAGAALWLVRGSSLLHWRSIGLDTPDTPVPLDQPSAPCEAARTNAAVSSGAAFAVPIAIGGEVVAVLSASNADGRAVDRDAVDVLACYAARCLESLTAFKAARAFTDGSGAIAPMHGAAVAAEANWSAGAPPGAPRSSN